MEEGGGGELGHFLIIDDRRYVVLIVDGKVLGIVVSPHPSGPSCP